VGQVISMLPFDLAVEQGEIFARLFAWSGA
jgi:hypothetical protein